MIITANDTVMNSLLYGYLKHMVFKANVLFGQIGSDRKATEWLKANVVTKEIIDEFTQIDFMRQINLQVTF